jgi:hypothetical protein
MKYWLQNKVNKRRMLKWVNLVLPLTLILILGYVKLLDPGFVFGKLQRSVIDLYSLSGFYVPSKVTEQNTRVHLIEVDEASLNG